MTEAETRWVVGEPGEQAFLCNLAQLLPQILALMYGCVCCREQARFTRNHPSGCGCREERVSVRSSLPRMRAITSSGLWSWKISALNDLSWCLKSQSQSLTVLICIGTSKRHTREWKDTELTCDGSQWMTPWKGITACQPWESAGCQRISEEIWLKVLLLNSVTLAILAALLTQTWSLCHRCSSLVASRLFLSVDLPPKGVDLGDSFGD